MELNVKKAKKPNTPNKQLKTHTIQQGVTASCKSKRVRLQPLKAQCNSYSWKQETNLLLPMGKELDCIKKNRVV